MSRKFIGIYAPYIEQYLSYKRQLGFKQITEEEMLANFDRFTVQRAENRLGITNDLATAWMQVTVNRSSSYNFHRAMLINHLAAFLNELGIPSYLMRLPLQKIDFTPYIFSQDELNRLFSASDRFRVKKGMRQIMFAIPALLRLLYGTGLRRGEALALTINDVNLDDQFLIVYDSKNGQERIIPFSDSLADVLRQYARYRDKLPANLERDDRFFIAPDGRKISPDCFNRWFSRLLSIAGIPKGRGVTPHALRHSFAVHSLAMMAEGGTDIYCSLPILATYLGHKNIESTNHYVRLVSTMYPGLLKDVDKICINVFPKITNYESN